MSMDTRYVLGVDGGNTKTDYFLFTANGDLRSFLRTDTCSHEVIGGYDNAYRKIYAALQTIYEQAGIEKSQIDGAVFGLAGVDIPSQKLGMEQVLQALQLKKTLVCNDGFLGIKAAANSGAGICSINGTGTVTVGIDQGGVMLQVGGIGAMTRDFAGGAFIARQAIAAGYARRFKNGEDFAAVPWIEERLQINSPDEWLEKIHSDYLVYKPFMTELVQLVFKYAREGDPTARHIVSQTALNMADGVIGCINQLRFDSEIEIVLAGSVWVKGGSELMHQTFKEHLENHISKKITIQLLQYPPSLGAVYWAWELAYNSLPDNQLKEKIEKEILIQKL